MDPLVLGAIVILIAMVFLFSGMPIAFALGMTSLVAMFLFMDAYQISVLAETVFEGVNDFGMLSIPLFIFMGMIAALTRAGSDLYECFHRWLYKVPGGLGIGNIGACSIFAALSGSSIATAAAIGSVAIPAMQARGYDPRLIFGSVGAGGTLGILIPPSITMIVYGYLGNVSIGRLFIGGVIPGLMLAGSFIFYIMLWAWRSPSIAPKLAERPSWREMLYSLVDAGPSILLILVVLGSIYAGVATPTEAAAVGAFFATVITICQGQFKWSSFQRCLRSTVCTTAMIGLIMIGAMMVAFALHVLRVPIALSEAIVVSGMNRYVALAAICVLLFVLGCFIDGMSILIIMTPILVALMKTLNFDLVWFGVIFTINIEISLITPPVGMNLFVLKGTSPSAQMTDIIRGVMPYVAILALGIVVMTIWPQTVIWLPALVMP